MLNILIADDHPIFSNGLKQIMAEEDGMEVSDEAAYGRQKKEIDKNFQERFYLAHISLFPVKVLDRMSEFCTVCRGSRQCCSVAKEYRSAHSLNPES